jgi:hypothetical protein
MNAVLFIKRAGLRRGLRYRFGNKSGERAMRIVMAGLMLGAAAPACAADYAVIQLHIDAKVPADTAWAKIGSYCDIAKWAKLPCELVAGSGGVGSIRKLVGGVIEEPMVAATAHSYTYGQTVGPNKDIDYHGTLAVEPTGAGTSRIDYTLTYDQSHVAADKRVSMRDGMAQRFQVFMGPLKAQAEGK